MQRCTKACPSLLRLSPLISRWSLPAPLWKVNECCKVNGKKYCCNLYNLPTSNIKVTAHPPARGLATGWLQSSGCSGERGHIPVHSRTSFNSWTSLASKGLGINPSDIRTISATASTGVLQPSTRVLGSVGTQGLIARLGVA